MTATFHLFPIHYPWSWPHYFCKAIGSRLDGQSLIHDRDRIYSSTMCGLVFLSTESLILWVAGIILSVVKWPQCEAYHSLCTFEEKCYIITSTFNINLCDLYLGVGLYNVNLSFVLLYAFKDTGTGWVADDQYDEGGVWSMYIMQRSWGKDIYFRWFCNRRNFRLWLSEIMVCTVCSWVIEGH